jgi:hypothetical protein
MNTSLLIKWWWKLEDKEGPWQKIVRAKYVRDMSIAFLEPKQGDSPC